MEQRDSASHRLLPYTGLLIAGIIGLSLIACSTILARSFLSARGKGEIIRVTGSARRAIRSDFIVWRCRVTERAATPAEAYPKLTADTRKIRDYLLGKGIDSKEIFPLAIETQVLYKIPATPYEAADAGVSRPVAGYELSQAIEVRSSAVDRVDAVARQSTELISGGIPVASQPPQYLYQQLGALKHDLLAEAAKDARIRAQRIAANCDCRVGELRFARMGVLQVQGLYDSDTITDTGANDTASLDKRVTAIVGAEFAIAK